MPPKKRASLAEKIDHVRLEGEEAIFLQMQELNEESEEYIGFRYAGKKTQLDQDRILKLYQQFVKTFFSKASNLSDSPSDQDLDSACFPPQDSDFYHRARCFLIWMITNASPRSSEDTHITYRTACAYRRHLLFWLRRKYDERNVEYPRPSKVFNQLTEAMRGAAMKRQLGNATTSKAYIGLAEIQFMIDIDTRATASIEVAEQHHLAWCLGRCTALRPSSIGPQPGNKREAPGPDGYDDFIMWKDVAITRGKEPGSFNARLTLRNLKTTRLDPEARADRTRQDQLVFNILSPQNKANIPFSVPHRILVIALRRGAILGIDTLEDLLSDESAVIKFRDEFLKKPIFLSANARGFTVIPDKPLPANALSAYIQIRGRDAGFPDKITFYSIRRRMATDLAQAFGNDAAREIMGHEPASRTLETSYLEFCNIRHTTAVGLEENPEEQLQDRRVALCQQLLGRLDGDLLARTRGEALNTLVNVSNPFFSRASLLRL
jgi:hypothetical protein